MHANVYEGLNTQKNIFEGLNAQKFTRRLKCKEVCMKAETLEK